MLCASRGEGDHFCLSSAAKGGAAVFEHQLIGLLDVLFQFPERRALAENAGHFSELPHIPVAISPIFQGELRGMDRHAYPFR